jgi:1-acyl-sn-glycerol-3-phosphate acyltransferase
MASPDAGMFKEPFLRRWSRRAVTFPAIGLIVGGYATLLPALLTYSVVRDLVRGRRDFPLPRFHLFLFGILGHHIVGLLILGGSWICTRFVSAKRRHHINVKVEHYFIPQSIGIAERVYNMKIELDNIECCSPGPILLLSRHASILDTIMPIKLLGQAHGMGMRIVQKAELLWNPLVDVASSRMPRAFIQRGSGNVHGPISGMKHLLRGITDNEALVVFPEGSRFSEAKKEKIVAKLSKSNPRAAERASELKHVLPARPAGTLALIEMRPDVDVVFMAHTGLERANRLEDFVDGALYKRTLRMKFWRVPADEIPTEREERIEWLHTEWRKVDAWIDANRDQD